MSRVRSNILFGLMLLSCVGMAQSVNNLQGPGQLRDLMEDSLNSYCIDPIAIDRYTLDSLTGSKKMIVGAGRLIFRFNPLIYQVQTNSILPFNHTSNYLLPNVGMQEVFSLGFNASIGNLLELNVQPVLMTAENLPFEQYPGYSREWLWYYYYLNRIDLPVRQGGGPLEKTLPGQSYVRIKHRNLAISVSTENKWWGPASFNPLVLGSNAPGFLHVGIKSLKPLQTRFGRFEFEVITGKLKDSGIFPPDTNRVNYLDGQKLYQPKIEDHRLVNGLVYTFQPKWISGLTLGFTRMSMFYRKDAAAVYDFLPINGFIGNQVSKFERDGKKASMGSWFLRYLMPASKAEVYFEYGRGDQSLHIWNVFDPDPYTRGFTAGFKKSFEVKGHPGKYIQLGTEITNLSLPTREQVRSQDPQSWYLHDYVRQGFTHRGVVLGSQLGPGSNGQNLYLQYMKGLDRFGIRLMRIIHNLDYYHYTSYYNSDHFNQYWASVGTMVYSTWHIKNFSINMNFGMQRELNYQWDWVRYTDIGFENIGNDKFNFSGNLMLSYHL